MPLPNFDVTKDKPLPIMHQQLFFFKVFNVFEDYDLLNTVDFVSRTVYLPQPIVTRFFRLNVVEGAPNVLVKMDLIGMSAEKQYSQDPIFEPTYIRTRKYFYQMIFGFCNCTYLRQVLGA